MHSASDFIFLPRFQYDCGERILVTRAGTPQQHSTFVIRLNFSAGEYILVAARHPLLLSPTYSLTHFFAHALLLSLLLSPD